MRPSTGQRFDNQTNMFNPFYPFTETLLQAMVDQGKFYFVRQSFRRGFNASPFQLKACFLMTHYDEMELAEEHFLSLVDDHHRFLYCWEIEEHRQRLKRATLPYTTYSIYSATLHDNWESQLPRKTKKDLKRYISGLGWRPRSGEEVKAVLELRKGELFICLRCGKRRADLTFEELENFG